MKKSFFLYLFFLLFFASCIEEYEIDPSLLKEVERPLYIEGHIINGGNSVFFITRATKMYEKEEAVEDASVMIESDAGYVSDMASYEGQGQYVITTGTLNDRQQYRLVVKADGETFVTEWQHVMPLVSIDEVNIYENGYAGAVDIRVCTTAPDDAPRHYLFTYEETWEIMSSKDFNSNSFKGHNGPSIMYDASLFPLLTPSYNPYLYCWTHRYSTNIMLYSTAELESNTIKNFVVRSIPAKSEEISVLYAIDIYQSALSDEAYEYYRNMERLTEGTGGIFSPTPYHYRGNVTCVSHPEVKVYGYVTASESKIYRYILDPKDLLRIAHDYTAGRANFKPVLITLAEWRRICLEAKNKGAVIDAGSENEIGNETYYYDRICFDCLARGGSKDKPSWWPNDHK